MATPSWIPPWLWRFANRMADDAEYATKAGVWAGVGAGALIVVSYTLFALYTYAT